jgi:hypothetical protein
VIGTARISNLRLQPKVSKGDFGCRRYRWLLFCFQFLDHVGIRSKTGFSVVSS